MLTALKERKADAESKEKGESGVLGLVSDSLAIVQFIPATQSEGPGG
jgi:hypothetical protein